MPTQKKVEKATGLPGQKSGFAVFALNALNVFLCPMNCARYVVKQVIVHCLKTDVPLN